MIRRFFILALAAFMLSLTPVLALEYGPFSARVLADVDPRSDIRQWGGSPKGVYKSECGGVLVKWGQPIEEASHELRSWQASAENCFRSTRRFKKLLPRLTSLLSDGECITCFFRVDEDGSVFGEKVSLRRNSQVGKSELLKIFRSGEKLPCPPNLWPKQVGMIGSFFRTADSVVFCLGQAPAENVQVGQFTGLGETVLEHYLWTPAQRKLKQKPRIRFVSIGAGCLQSY
jgi:hypothetical protein